MLRGFIRANRKLREAEVVIIRYGISDRELLAEAKLKRILLLRRNYQIAALFRARPLMLRIRHQAESLIRDAAEAFLRSGSRFSYQQVRLWADRFDLPPEVTRPPDLYEAPPSRLGYEHLGFPMAQMMVLRDEIDTGRRVADESAAKEVLEKSQLAGRLGLHTEGWKLNYLLLKKFSKYRKPDILKKFLRSFARCEYAPLMRVLLLLIRG
jgi:hypothetical protein